MKFFKSLAELFLALPASVFTPSHIVSLEELSNCLMPQLRDQMCVYLLWFFELWRNTSSAVQNSVLGLLRTMYTKGPKTICKNFGVAKIVNVL